MSFNKKRYDDKDLTADDMKSIRDSILIISDQSLSIKLKDGRTKDIYGN